MSDFVSDINISDKIMAAEKALADAAEKTFAAGRAVEAATGVPPSLFSVMLGDVALSHRPCPSALVFDGEEECQDAIENRRILRGQLYAIVKALEAAASFAAFVSPDAAAMIDAQRKRIAIDIATYEANKANDHSKTQALAAARDSALVKALEVIVGTANKTNPSWHLTVPMLEELSTERDGMPRKHGGRWQTMEETVAKITHRLPCMDSWYEKLHTTLTVTVQVVCASAIGTVRGRYTRVRAVPCDDEDDK